MCVPLERWVSVRPGATSREQGATTMRIPPDLVAHSVTTWAAVPIHLGARSERSDEWMVRLTFSWPRNRFPSSCASTALAVPRHERCGRLPTPSGTFEAGGDVQGRERRE